MRIKLLATIACEFGTGSAGQTIELPNNVAAGLVAGGYAVQLDVHLGDEPAAVEPEPAVEAEPAKTSKKTKRK